ncbi:MAG: hypothetical protein Q9174_004578 [Haloplaca sp. 1 TL-2023]
MNTSDSMTIVTLVASCPTAEQAWNRSENHFDNKPKNLEKGFTFGLDPQKCDVLLGGWPSFSREHFRITLNAQGDVVLEDTSRVGTCVEYKSEKPSGRNKFSWILFPYYSNIEVTLNKGTKLTNELVFKVEWPNNRKSCPAEYEAYRHAYLEARRNALPALSQLGVGSQQTTAVLTAQYSPKKQPIYLKGDELGRGSFGTVSKAVDVSTGYEYAAKLFRGGDWNNEVEILKGLWHEYIIVEYVAFSEEQGPTLVMEFLPFGNLTRQKPITEEDNLQIICQGLQALEHLHSQSPPLAHRDIKPDNILVRSRIPFIIKLVDFGFAKYHTMFESFCETNEYAAPEVWDQLGYTTMVDIWSLGVVVLKYGYGLPKPSQKRKGRLWCHDISKAAKDIEEHALIDLISNKMLQMDDRHRQSASDSLAEFYRLGFHTIPPVEIVYTTPTVTKTGRDGVTRTGSIKIPPLGNVPSDSLWSPFQAMGGASGITDLAATKRELQEGEYIRISKSGSNATPMQKIRQRPQRTRGGQSKRPRSLLLNEAGGSFPRCPFQASLRVNGLFQKSHQNLYERGHSLP